MIEDLGPENKVLLLPNHGAITLGKSVHEAFYLTHQLVEACKVQIMTQSSANSRSGYSVVGRTNRGRDLSHRPEQLYGK